MGESYKVEKDIKKIIILIIVLFILIIFKGENICLLGYFSIPIINVVIGISMLNLSKKIWNKKQ